MIKSYSHDDAFSEEEEPTESAGNQRDGEHTGSGKSSSSAAPAATSVSRMHELAHPFRFHACGSVVRDGVRHYRLASPSSCDLPQCWRRITSSFVSSG